MVADANLGNKSNHSILQSLTYDVSLQADGTINGRATVAYDYSDRVASLDPAVEMRQFRAQYRRLQSI